MDTNNDDKVTYEFRQVIIVFVGQKIGSRIKCFNEKRIFDEFSRNKMSKIMKFSES